MARKIVLCSDGTGNTFDARVTNVTRLIECLRVDDAAQQQVIYDQGAGATARRRKIVEDKSLTRSGRDGLKLLPPPVPSRLPLGAWSDRARGLLFGYGLKENVRELYQELAGLYQGTEDSVFLFGFSRGAFTVRALAGLIYRCGLPHQGSTDFGERFERAWALYQPMVEDTWAVSQLREEHRPCVIHCMGLWDTVKSYGGLTPIILPHLRHNPVVAHVRHALALNEKRAWFKPTTWGLLDVDERGAMTRLKQEDRGKYQEQDIAEVWFAGCHSDIGGGNKSASPRVALRWMLAEAASLTPAIDLNDIGRALLQSGDPATRPVVRESHGLRWRVVEQIPRKEIDNSGTYPVRGAARGSDGERHPDALRRRGEMLVHATAASSHGIAGCIGIRDTKLVPLVD